MNSTIDVLRRDFRGEIIEPDSPGYESARRTVLVPGSPDLVLRPKSVGDVQAAVRFAVDAGLPVSVRGGGHSFAGFGTAAAGVVIDLGELASVDVVDEERHRVRIEGGATWGRVADVLGTYGLAISSGDTRSVGVGGLTLAGGIGWKVRKYGLAIDSLLAAEVVTAAGQIVRTSVDEHPELFWGLRGGGGNFGVVTAFEFAAHPTTEVFHGSISFPAAEVSAVLDGWARHLRTAPHELTSTVELANPFAGGAEAPVVVHVVYDGDDPRAAAEVIDPLRGIGTVIGDDVTRGPYADTLVEGAVPPPGLQFVTRDSFVETASVPEALRILAEVARSGRSPSIAIRSVGGAVSRVAEDATAYAHRRAELMVATVTVGPDALVAAALPALDALWADLAPHVSGAYSNFLSSASPEDIAAIYPARTYERLAAVKRRYDPDNLFARNHNVVPAPETPSS